MIQIGLPVTVPFLNQRGRGEELDDLSAALLGAFALDRVLPSDATLQCLGPVGLEPGVATKKRGFGCCRQVMFERYHFEH